MSHIRRLLEQGLPELGLRPSEERVTTLIRFLGELARWNKRFNLTAVTDPREMTVKHLLDSLSIHPYIHGARVADIGTGAGLPGLPLALFNPDREFLLLDSVGKKTRFVAHATATLGLSNVVVRQGRVQDYRPETGFDTVVSRAFASLRDFVDQAGHLCGAGGRMLAMKGAYPDEEIGELPPEWAVEIVHNLCVPGLDAERHLVICCAQK